MFILRYSILLILITSPSIVFAQTAEEIVSKYIDAIGGHEAWLNVNGLEMHGHMINSRGIRIPFYNASFTSGKGISWMEFQGNKYVVYAYNGNVVWGSNQQTLKPEIKDSESLENYKRSINEIPNPFINYAQKGYSIHLLGTEHVNNKKAYKIKLSKTPTLSNGKEQENIDYYYFDATSFLPIKLDRISEAQGQQRVSETYFKNYQSVDGYIMAFATEIYVNKQRSQSFEMDTIVINPDIPDTLFEIDSEK